MGNSANLDNDITNLVAAALAGDQQAWRTLVSRFSPLVWTIVRSHQLSSADCEDVYQMSWLRTVQYLGKLRSPDRMAGWIATAARRECFKHIERSRRHLPVGGSPMLDRPEPNVDGPEDLVVRRAYHLDVLAAFRKLPERDQTLLGVLMTDPPPSYDEVSLTLGLPCGSIGPLRQRALARLRALLPVATG